jgi:hypothetical protein
LKLETQNTQKQAKTYGVRNDDDDVLLKNTIDHPCGDPDTQDQEGLK